MKYGDLIRQTADNEEMAKIISDAPLCQICDAIKATGRCPRECYGATVKFLEMEVEDND